MLIKRVSKIQNGNLPYGVNVGYCHTHKFSVVCTFFSD